jgi:hypothetical protein
MKLIGKGIRSGVWEGTLTGAAAVPSIQVMHLGQALAGITLVQVVGAQSAGSSANYILRVPIPAELLSDGVQTFLIRDAASEATLGHFTIIAGEAAADDLRAEVDLLRAELDLMKRAFRGHCIDTGG